MPLSNLLGIAVALAMDALAVAMVVGLTSSPLTRRRVFRLSFHFGLFQALMPTLGWLVGAAVERWVSAFDHWVALALLGFVGGNMIREALKDDAHVIRSRCDPTRGWELVLLSVATSIDALAVGLSLGVMGIPIVFPAIVIGLVAAGFTLVGMLLGRRLGTLWGKRVEILGGILLIGIGIKIVFDHLGLMSFT